MQLDGCMERIKNCGGMGMGDRGDCSESLASNG